MNIHLIHRDFYHLFLLDLFVITMVGLVNLRYLHFICIFMNAIKSELLTLTFQSDIVRIGAHIKLSPFYCKTNTLTNWDLHHQPRLSIYHAYPIVPLATICCLSVSKMYKKWEMSHFFTRDCEKNIKKHFQTNTAF